MACSLLLLGLGCGRVGDETRSGLELGTLSGPGYLASNEAAPAIPDSTPGRGEPPAAGEGPPAGEEEVPAEPELYPGASALFDVIERACGDCHADDPDAPGSVLFSIPGLLGGWLMPNSGEASLLAVWLQYDYGDARPGHSRFATEPGDYRAVVDFINGMPPTGCSLPSPFPRDVAAEAMLKDIESRDPADRPFIRYIGIQHASPMARCGAYSIQDSAIIELVNAVSLGPRVVIPPYLETGYTHAIDLRDYAWNRPIDLGGGGPDRTFPDAWEALVAAASPLARELTGPEADALKLATGTAIPYLPGHAFAAVASTGDLYHALVGLGANVNDTRDALGVVDTGLRRAGMLGGAQLAPERVVVRRVQGGEPGRSWWTREWTDPEAGPGGLRENPVLYPQSGQEIMFELPNGLYAYAIATPDGSRVAQVPACTGGVCDPPIAAESSVTCRGCHGSGRLMLPPDEVRALAESDPSAYDAPTLAAVREQYRPDELTQLLASDSRRYDATFEPFGEDLRYWDVIGMTYHEFWRRPVDAYSAAGELGVTREELRAVIPVVDPEGTSLAPWLGEGGVERSLFLDRFRALDCALGGSRNVPAGCP